MHVIGRNESEKLVKLANLMGKDGRESKEINNYLSWLNDIKEIVNTYLIRDPSGRVRWPTMRAGWTRDDDEVGPSINSWHRGPVQNMTAMVPAIGLLYVAIYLFILLYRSLSVISHACFDRHLSHAPYT